MFASLDCQCTRKLRPDIVHQTRAVGVTAEEVEHGNLAEQGEKI